MSSSQQALGLSRPLAFSRPPWCGRLQGSDTAWAVAFVVPYVGIFAAFVVYPAVYGLWMGSDPSLYGLLFSDPRYVTTLINTLLFVAIGVNVKMFLAFLLSGFFMSRSWWVRSLLAVYLLPWALPGLTVFLSIHYMLVTEWGLLDSLWRAVTGEDGPLFLVSQPLAMTANIVVLHLEMDAVLDADLSRRPHGDPGRHLRGGGNRWSHRLSAAGPRHVPAAGECLSHLHAALDGVDVGRLPDRLLRLQRRPARLTDVLATYGFHEAFDFGYPKLGMAAMMSALPILIPLVILLMRRIRVTGVQL